MEVFWEMKHADGLYLHDTFFMFFMQITHRRVNETSILADARSYEVQLLNSGTGAKN
jgi:hypothetical protein